MRASIVLSLPIIFNRNENTSDAASNLRESGGCEICPGKGV